TRPSNSVSDLAHGIDPSTVVLHEEVDLRPVYLELGLFSKDQGRRPSCSVFAVVSALEYESGLQNGTATRLSEEFLIWAMREMHPGIPVDDGYHFREVMTALQTYGVPPFEMVPNTFGKRVDLIDPSKEAIAAATARRGATPVWFRLDDPQLLERIVGALNHGKPVIIGLRWPNWRTFWDTNLLHKQTPMEDGGHAVTLVGYRNPSGSLEEIRFIFRNSFGPEWGLAGCGFVTGHYLTQNLLSAFYLNVP
ncbi:MAG TPA: C1 family peptidase, partial [Oceanipulchritudo sp.]|nr:C1 family peptidase [Oceanipulchritudo sp.]